MKPSLSLASVLAVTLAGALSAQDGKPNAPTPPPPPPEPPSIPVSADDEGRLKALLDGVHQSTRELANRAGSEARAFARQTKRAFENWPRAFGGSHGPRTLVLPGGLGRPETLGPGHEDLSVMAAIFAKALNPEPRHFELARLGGGDLDAMYLDGYGALFFLNADLPLAAPPQAAAAPAAKAEDTTWERTKRELRGGDVRPEGGSESWGDEEQPKFSAEKVAALQRRITEALKHAKNLRNLKTGETVTVVILGQSTGRRTRVGRVDKGEVGEGESGTVVSPNIVGYVNSESLRQSTLVIRATKTDILRFANGELSADEFAKIVAASAY